MHSEGSNRSKAICLDVAIDHRIRHLFGAVLLPKASSDGTHVTTLKEYGRELGVPAAEINVTATLAGPVSTRGIAVILQQPRDYHPFEKGVTAVIRDCKTLSALEELFDTASLGTLRMKDNISILDLLPYTPASRMEGMSAQEWETASSRCTQIVYGKNPAVILCTGRINAPKRHDFRKRNMRLFEKITIGSSFRISHIGEQRQICRVNGFHPSYAMNHHPIHSTLRQLLLLEVAHTCGVARGDWREEPWMDEIRNACSILSQEINGQLQYQNVISHG